MPMNPRLLRPTSSTLDADAAVYLNAVAVADGQQLEPAVRKAINDFVVGCKRDGIWNAIKASCILMGARTLAGALTPLVGTAPTNNGPFVSGDYNRETGLVGNGSTKYLASGRNNNADPQNNKHLAVYKSADNSIAGVLIGINSIVDGASWLFDNSQANSDTVRINSSPSIIGLQLPAAGFIGATRSASGTLTYRFSAASTSVSSTSQTQFNEEIDVLRGASNQYANARLAFYSIGESLTLSLLDTRVSTLYTAIGAAI